MFFLKFTQKIIGALHRNQCLGFRPGPPPPCWARWGGTPRGLKAKPGWAPQGSLSDALLVVGLLELRNGSAAGAVGFLNDYNYQVCGGRGKGGAVRRSLKPSGGWWGTRPPHQALPCFRGPFFQVKFCLRRAFGAEGILSSVLRLWGVDPPLGFPVPPWGLRKGVILGKLGRAGPGGCGRFPALQWGAQNSFFVAQCFQNDLRMIHKTVATLTPFLQRLGCTQNLLKKKHLRQN